jgi:enterochelin esterase-like enzyme
MTYMARKLACILAISFALCAAAQDKAPVRLEAGKPITASIRPGEVQRYQIVGQTGEFFKGSVHQDGIEINIKGFFPDRSKIREFSGPPTGARNFRFVAEYPGLYQLELTGVDRGQSEGRYTISLDQVQTMTERLDIPLPEQFSNQQIRALERQLASGDREAIGHFWIQVKHQGTPLVEEIPNDPSHALVTFLWQETFEIHNVLVLWNPFATDHPDDYQMSHLKDTDVWFKTLRVPSGARFLYQLSPNDTLSRSPNAQRFATAQADPLNPRRQPVDPNVTRYEVWSVAELPGASPQPWSDPRPGVPAGQLHQQTIQSKVLGNERSVTVYTPPGYTANANPYPMLMLFDETTYQSQVPAPVILDNLIAERRIPPMVAVLVNYPNQEARDRELFANPRFEEFICKELVPWVSEKYHVSADPSRNILGGLSAGGFAAAFIALHHSDIFGNVISQSGAFWWSPRLDQGEEPDWLAREYASSPRQPIKFYLEAGLFENDVKGSGGQILETNRHLRDVLRAKGNQVTYHEFPGGHDYLTWRGSFADALLALAGIQR